MPIQKLGTGRMKSHQPEAVMRAYPMYQSKRRRSLNWSRSKNPSPSQLNSSNDGRQSGPHDADFLDATRARAGSPVGATWLYWSRCALMNEVGGRFAVGWLADIT